MAEITDKTDTNKPQWLKRIKRHQADIGLFVLVVYVLILGLGTVGEVWKVEWILDLPLFRPPGRY